MINSDDCGVKVSVRERPMQDNVFEESIISYAGSSKNILQVDGRSFAFDLVFPPNVSQKQLFDELIQPMVGKALSGFNCTALAYGQTGTGKTYTMGLKAEEDIESEDVGIVPRCIEEIFKYAENSDEPRQVSVAVSFIEIYNEKVYDMLSENPRVAINIKGQKFSGGLKKPISNLKEGHELIVKGNKSRHVRPTKMNLESSRSHAIFTLHTTVYSPSGNLSSCFNLVDLAGSERVQRTGHQGVAYTEGVCINQGLLSIVKVLKALASNAKVIPYRDNVLSSVLQDSLSSNSYLVLLACISPYEDDRKETLTTLRFAQNTKTLKNTPIANLALSVKKPKISPSLSRTRIGVTPKRNGSNIFKFATVKKRPLLHSNTFTSPNNIRNIENRRINHSEIGLTPTEKRKKIGILTPRNKMSFYLEEKSISKETQRNLNDSIGSITSRISLNVSASTAIETPKTNSYSPLLKKCVQEIEASIENKMVEMFEKFKNELTPAAPVVEQTETPKVFSNEGLILKTLLPQLRTIVRDEVNWSSRYLQSFADETPKCLVNSTTPLSRHLFVESPQFKMPEVPPAKIIDSNKTLDFESSNNCFHQDGNKTVVIQPRRSLRLSMKAKEKEASLSSENVNTSSVEILENATEGDEKRPGVRRSIRIQNKENIKEREEKQKIYSRRKVPTKNKTIAGYFSKRIQGDTSKIKKPTKEEHEAAVLHLLNTGTIQELQILPQIGLKTAYQIITYVTLHGKFKNFQQVAKAPLWRGKGWKRFKEANNIS